MPLSSERSQHCPFLNRTDSRCGQHFHLDHLDHAFEYCFDRYTACPTYLERLVERRLRQDEQAHPVHRTAAYFPGIKAPLVQVTIHAAARASAPAQLADAHTAGHAVEHLPVVATLARAVAGPRISAQAIVRGFDRLAKTVFRDVGDHDGGTHTGRAA